MFYLSDLTNKASQRPRRPDLNLELDSGTRWCWESKPPPSLPTPCAIPHQKVLSQRGVDSQHRTPALPILPENCPPPVTLDLGACILPSAWKSGP